MNKIIYSMLYDMRRQPGHWYYVGAERAGLAVGSPEKPLWVWLREDKNELDARYFFTSYLHEYPKPLSGLVARPDAAYACAAVYAETSGCFFNGYELIAYYLPENEMVKTLRPKGYLRPAAAEDSPLLEKWINEFYRETLETAAPADSGGKTQNNNAYKENDAQLYIWQDSRPSAMGMICGGGDTMRLNLIHTPKPLRNKGYGKGMVTALAELVFKAGKIPVLYTAAGNAAANRLYRAVGFKEAGRLAEIRFASKGNVNAFI